MTVLQRWSRPMAFLAAASLVAMLVAMLVVTVPIAHPATSGGRALSQETGTDPARLDAFVTDQMERADIPGVAYAVVGPEGVEHQATFGVDGDGEPVTPATAFLWGSVAKPVTATLVVLMTGSGELDVDTPVVDYLPDFRLSDESASDTITVRHLLNQTSGIPQRLDLTDRYDAGRRPGDVVPELHDVEPVGRVGEEHVYSSINYVLLAAVVEKVTGRPFGDVLTERVLEPTGMDTALTSAADATDQLPPGHRYVLGGARPFTSDYDEAGLSSGYLGGSLDDLVAFARANLSGSTLLDDDQRAALTAAEVSTGDDRSYGLGWRTWPVAGADAAMTWHSGAAPGYQATVLLLPERDRAVVVLQNVYGSFQEDELLDTGWGLASLSEGAEPELHDAGPLYLVVLGALGAVCLALVGATVAAARRLLRPAGRSSRRRLLAGSAAWLVVLAVTAGLLLSVPGFYGVSLGQVVLWAPDIAYLVLAGLVLAALAVVVRLAASLRALLTPRIPA